MNSWLPNPYRIVIIGSGVSGLSAAHTLLKYSKIPCHIKIIETQNRVGGWLQSSRFADGSVIEHGPRTARSYGPAAIQALNILSDSIPGIEKHMIGIPKSLPAAKRRYIYANGNLCELPSSFVSMFTRQEPFSKSLISCIINELFRKRSEEVEDESVYSFFERRFNSEIANYMSTPLCKGIFGGDARALSLRSCFPILFNYERQHGSVIKGALFTKKTVLKNSELAKKAKTGKWMAWTLTNGMETLPELWCEQLKALGVDIQLNTTCNKLRFISGNKVEYTTNNNKTNNNGIHGNNSIHECDRVISTIPVSQLYPLIDECDHKLAGLLKSINYANMAVISLQYKNVNLPADGFGVLIPSSEQCDILGVTFDSLFLPQHSIVGMTTVTVMAGGAWFDELFGHPDNVDVDKIKELAVKSVRDILRIQETPSHVVCKIQKQCIPQYEVGHHERVGNIDDHIKSNSVPLTLLGNMSGGVGVNDVIVNARNETLKWLSSNHMY